MAIILPIATKFDDSGIKKAEGSFGSLGGSIKKMVGFAAGAAGVALAIKGIGESVKAAAEDAKSQKLLAEQLTRTTGATKEQIATNEAFVQKLSMATGQLDDNLRPALANAVRGTGSLAGGQKLLQIALDGAAASGKPLDAVMSALVKAQNGNTKSLYMLAPQLKKTKGGIDDFATSVKGAAEQTANPFDRFKVAMDSLKETIGAALLPVINNLASALMPIITQIGPLLANVIGALKPIFDALIAVMPGLMTALKPIIDVLKMLADIVVAVAVPIINLLLPVITMLGEMMKKTLGAVLPMIGKMFADMAPMLGLFIQAVLKIVGALLPLIPVLLKLVFAFMPLTKAILPPLTKLLLALVPVILLIVNTLTTMLTPVIDIVATLANWLGVVLGGAINAIAGWITALMPVFKTVFTFIGDFVTGIFNGVITGFKGFVNMMIDGVNGIIDGLNTVLEGVKWASGGTIDLKIGKIPKLAQGGIVPATPGGRTVQVAEGGQAEAIIPLSKLNMGKGGSTYNITVNAGVGADGASIGNAVIKAIKTYERVNGKGWRN
jgi:hypothetical protein